MRIFAFIALLLLLLSASCTDNEHSRETLIGSWRYDTEAILDSLRIQEPTENELAMVQGAMTIYKDAVFDFKEDGALIVVTNGIEQSGTWEMSSNGKQMTINLSGQGQPNDILELTHERLMLAPIPEAGVFYKRIFVPASAPR